MFPKLKNKWEGQCAYDIKLWRVRVAIVAIETQKCLVCAVEIHVTVDIITILSVAQQWFHGKFMWLATTECT